MVVFQEYRPLEPQRSDVVGGTLEHLVQKSERLRVQPQLMLDPCHTPLALGIFRVQTQSLFVFEDGFLEMLLLEQSVTLVEVTS